VVVAERMSGSKMYELVKIGWDKLIGEIIKIEGDTASIQCYEDTCKSIIHSAKYISLLLLLKEQMQRSAYIFCENILT